MHSAVRQAEMYGAIGEEDVLAGLWKRRCRTENTRAGEMLMQVSAILHCRMSNVICSLCLHSKCPRVKHCLLGTGPRS